LSIQLRAGGQYNDYFNDAGDESDISPYVRASARYVYAPESYLSAGFNQGRSAIDAVGIGAGPVIRDVETSLLFASLRHRIVPNLFGSLIGTFQNSTFNGGGNDVDGESEQYYSLGLNLEYRINPFLSTEIGYNYDRVDSDLNRDYDRNRVYIGLTASY
jgi:hypothetical protein